MVSTKFREVVGKAAQQSAMKEEVLQSMSDFVFSNIKKEMGQFNNLSIHMMGWWTWFYKYKGRSGLETLNQRIDTYQNLLDGKEKRIFMKYRSFLGQMEAPELKAMKEKVTNLLSLYEQYVTEKKEIRDDNSKIIDGRCYPDAGGDQ